MSGRRHTGFVNRHHLVPARVRERPQQHLVDDRKDRRVAADADGEGEDHRGREPRRSPQPARYVANVAQQVLDA